LRETGIVSFPNLSYDDRASASTLRLSTRERSAAPCRRVDGWRACKTMKAAPDIWRLLASVSVDETGLQRRNLAETGTDSECERDNFGRFRFAHRCLGRRASLSFRAPKYSSRAMSCGQPRFRSESLRKENASERVCVRVLRPHTNTIAEVHDCFCAADDHFLIISAHLDYYRSRGGRTT
jgi:hypothetical protein